MSPRADVIATGAAADSVLGLVSTAKADIMTRPLPERERRRGAERGVA